MAMIEMLGALYSEAYGLVNAVLIRLWLPLQICLVYFCLEWAFPRSRNSLGSYLRAASFVAVSVAINLVPMNLATTLFGADQRKPLAILDMTPLTESPNLAVRAVGWVLAVYAIAFIGHVTYYWYHRAQHAIPWMWRLHKVHHSIREMSAASSYHHVTEDVFQYACTVVPMSFLLGVEQGPVPWLVLAVVGTQAHFIHSSTRVGIGPLRYILGDNTFHRIHHSMEPQHFNKNFGTTTPLWDVLFGTAYFPKRGEWPAVGLADTPPPSSVREYLLMPFRSEAPRLPAKA